MSGRQYSADDAFQLLDIQRFGEIGSRAFPEAFIAAVDCGVSGTHDHFDRRATVFYSCEEGEAIERKHLDIEDNQVKHAVVEQRKCLIAVGRCFNQLTLLLEYPLKES